MEIKAYFDKLRKIIKKFDIADSFDLECDKRGNFEGYVRCTMYFPDNSELHVREYVDVEHSIDKLLYAYHYMDKKKELVFRYDNSGHYQNRGIGTYPHHKHVGPGDKIESAKEPDLSLILDEVRRRMKLGDV